MAQLNLDYVSRSCMMDVGMSVASPHYIMFLKWANDGFRELQVRGISPRINCVELTVDADTMTVDLPDDYEEYTKVAFCHNDRLITLDVNDSICLCDTAPTVTVCDCDEETVSTLTTQSDAGLLQAAWYYPYFTRSMNGQYTAGFYGYGSNLYRGGFKIDKVGRKIHFDSWLTATTIVLEYQSNSLQADGNPIIEQGEVNCLREYVHYQRCRMSFDRAENMKAEGFRRAYVNQASGIARRKSSMTMSDWYTLFRRTTYLRPKV